MIGLIGGLVLSLVIHGTVLVQPGASSAFEQQIIDDAERTFPGKNTSRSYRIGDPKSAEEVDLGDLFLRDELENEPFVLVVAKERWAQRRAVHAHLGSLTQVPPRERVHRVITELVVNDHLSSYILASSKMSGFLDGADLGGNCEAETRMIIAALQAANIDLTGDDVLGVQVFDDHIQPVILDRRKHTVWVLLDGVVEHEIRAPIYLPSLLTRALLVGRGFTPSVRLDDLLLVSPPVGVGGVAGLPANRGFATDSRSEYPRSGVRSTAAQPPSRSTIRVPSAPMPATARAAASVDPNAPRVPTDANEPTENIDATVSRTDVKPRPNIRQEDAISYETCAVLAAGTLSFREPADAVMFNQLPTYETRARYVLEVAQRELVEPMLIGPTLSSRIENGDTVEVRQRLRDLHRVVDAAACAREAITSLAVASRIFAGQNFVGDEEPFATIAKRADTPPLVEKATREIDEMIASVKADPQAFLRRISTLSHDTRSLLLTLLPARDYAHVIAPVLRSLYVEPTRQDIADVIEPQMIELDLDLFSPSELAVSTSPPVVPLSPASSASAAVSPSSAPTSQASAPVPSTSAAISAASGSATASRPSAAASSTAATKGATREPGVQGPALHEPIPVPNAASVLVVPADAVPVSIDAYLDLLVFWVAQRPESLFEGLPAEARRHWAPTVEARWQERKKHAPRREQLYTDHLASLLNTLPTKAPPPLPSRFHGSDAPRALQRCVHRETLPVLPGQAREDGRRAHPVCGGRVATLSAARPS